MGSIHEEILVKTIFLSKHRPGEQQTRRPLRPASSCKSACRALDLSGFWRRGARSGIARSRPRSNRWGGGSNRRTARVRTRHGTHLTARTHSAVPVISDYPAPATENCVGQCERQRVWGGGASVRRADPGAVRMLSGWNCTAATCHRPCHVSVAHVPSGLRTCHRAPRSLLWQHVP
eukprot:1358647-Rhodomonas_salina.1